MSTTQFNIPGATPAPESNELNGTYRGGPRTEAGLAASSQNAIKSALFTAGDFVRPHEEQEYAEMSQRLLEELNPNGALEHTLFDEIRSASWRLRRCRKVEANLVLALNSGPVILDPMEATMNPRAEKVQNSVDRARAQADRLLKQSMSELRKLQTERQINGSLAPEDHDVIADGLFSRHELLKVEAEERRVTLVTRKLAATKPAPAKPAPAIQVSNAATARPVASAGMPAPTAPPHLEQVA
jgi:hypothetical protein